VNEIVLDWFRKVTDSKIFGFFLTESMRYARASVHRYYVNEKNQSLLDIQMENHEKGTVIQKKLYSELRENNFVQSFLKGYDSFFIIPGGENLITQNEELVVEGNVTASKLKTAFMKFNKKKSVNRVLVSKFITGIATH
jgi:hypothetical protein